MKTSPSRICVALGFAATMLAATAGPGGAQSLEMNFFLSPGGPGGTDFGAVVMSDGHCQDVGYAAGFGDLTWKAYITGTEADGEAGEVARERIGSGPFVNYYGVVIAESVEHLHSDDNNLTRETAVSATGEAAPENLTLPPGSELDGGDFNRNGPLLCFGV